MARGFLGGDESPPYEAGSGVDGQKMARRRSYCIQIDFDTIAGAFDSKPIGAARCRPFYFTTKAFHV